MSERRRYSYKPSVKKMWDEAKSRLDISSPESVTLDQIAQVSREILQKMEKIPVK